MSYILDALKKVEHEKTRKVSSGGMTSISGDLFLERVPLPSRGSAGKIIAAIVIVALLSFAAAWFVLKGNSKKVAVPSKSTAPTAVTAPTVSPIPPAPVPPPPLPVPSPPQQIPLPAAPPAKAPAPPVNTQSTATPSDDVERVSKNEKKARRSTTTLPKPQKIAVQTIPAPADIKVSGIAWQEEHAARRVVINGFLLQEGTTVSGAKILEIHPDRVRFSSPAGIFDLRMDGAAALSSGSK
jgi:type IV secretory pathway VirB10-like protein